jgi:4'-phosphopantetheinyl transferase EntD
VSLTNSIGIDIEPCDQRLDDVHSVVLAPTEAMPSAAGLAQREGGVDPVLISFCAKEAVFKATWPLDHVWREFGDVAITVTGNTFAVTWAAEPLPGEVVGQWAIHADHVVTTAWVI